MSEVISSREKELLHPGIDLLWALIPDCNLRCKYCYFGNPENHFNWHTQSNITPEDHISFAHRITHTSVKHVTIAGGDPLQVEYLPQLVRILNKGNIDTAISTNGLLLTQDLLEALFVSGLHKLFISLDSPTSEYHDQMRGFWDKSVKALYDAVVYRNAILGDQKIGVYMTITQQNYNQIPAMVDFLENLGVDYLEFQPVSLHPAQHLYQQLDFTANRQLRDAFSSIAIQATREGRAITLPSTLYMSILEKVLNDTTISIDNCFGGRSLFFIDPFGDIWPCPSNKRKSSNDKRGNIITISEDDFKQLFVSTEKDLATESCQVADRDCVCMFELKSSRI